jgi:queuine tRNA-ribosyltransferase
MNNTEISSKQALFGVVQGGRFEELRKESATVIANMAFDGFGIGGSFAKEDMAGPVRWVNEILPEEKPRHLLGIGEPADIFVGVENGCDLFDCVMPTRLARHGTIYTLDGPAHLKNKKYKVKSEK